VIRWAWMLLWGAAAAVQAASVSYYPLEFQGAAEHGVFATDLDGDGTSDLVALGRGRISVYRGQKGKLYPKTPEIILTGSAAYFADVADIAAAPGNELVVLTAHGISCFVHSQGRYASRAVKVLETDTILSLPLLRGAIENVAFATVDVLPWNFAFDADGDGRDDILVPHGDGTDVYLQTQPGTFAKPIRLRLFPLIFHSSVGGLQADALAKEAGGRVRLEFVMREMERRDVNGDGKPDLYCKPVVRMNVLVAEAIWFAQKHTGGFDPVPANVPGGLQLTPDRQRVDINGDGRIDRIAEENALDDPFNIITRVRYWLADKDGRLTASPTDTIGGQNILVHTFLPVHDFNGDKALDFAMYKTDITVTQVAKWIRQSFGQIEGDLNLYYFDRKANRYPRTPAYTKPIRMSFKVDLQDVMIGGVWERYLSTMMRFNGDYNGDGRLDLLVREKTHRIGIYFNTGNGRRLYRRDPDVVIEDLPMFGGMDIGDLNSDGCDDLILSAAHDLFAPGTPRADVIAVYVSQRK